VVVSALEAAVEVVGEAVVLHEVDAAAGAVEVAVEVPGDVAVLDMPVTPGWS
jgi:hypothetical protein